MTIGQRIAEERKKLGISQEALGEKMGVSRQAISKWESDGAVPEIDKLIALSKLFGVSVGWLLGVEENPSPIQDTEALSEKQLYMIEEIMKKYQMPPEAPRRRLWKGILKGALTGFVICACALSLYQMSTADPSQSVLKGMNDRISALESAGVTEADLTPMENLLSNMTAALENVSSRVSALESAGASDAIPALLAEYSFEIQQQTENAAPLVNFLAVPNSWKEGDQAYLDIRGADGTLFHQACQGSGAFLSAECILPLQDDYRLCFTVVHPDGTQDQQVLVNKQVEDLESTMTLSIEADPGRGTYQKGRLTIDDLITTVTMPMEGFRQGNLYWTKIDLVILQDGQELARQDLLGNSDGEALYSYCLAANYLKLYFEDINLKSGDIISLYIEAELSNGSANRRCIADWQYSNGKLI